MTTTAAAPRIEDIDITTFPQEVQDHLNTVHQKGAFQKATITSQVKPAAAHKGTDLVKVTEAIIRTGIGYENLAANEGIETGDLPWGEWAVYPYLVQHKGAWYVRLYVKGDSPIKVTYFVNGEKVGKEFFNSHLTPSAAKPKKNTTGTISAKIENVVLG